MDVKHKKVISLLVALMMVAGLVAGCGQSTSTAPSEPQKVKLGYSGGACESFLFAAYEKGFFKEEGIEVELVKTDFETLKESLATNKIQGANGMAMKWAKPIEQGIDVVFAAGIHTGCIQLLVPKDSEIRTIADLKGKVVGNNGMGDGPMVFATRALAAAGLDYQKDIQWRSYPITELEGVMKRGEVSAIVLTDPIAQILVDQGKAKTLLSTTMDDPYKAEYCCMATLSGKLYREDPATAAAVVKGMMRGARWVSEHPEEAAQLAVEKKYIPGDPALIAKLLKSYNYIPSIAGGEKAVERALQEMAAVGILNPNTNITEMKNKIFVHLPGLEDQAVLDQEATPNAAGPQDLNKPEPSSDHECCK